MRTRTYFLEGLLELHTIAEPSTRRGIFRQSIASLGHAASIDAPGPLDGLHPDAVLKSVRVALADNLLDDLDWLAPAAAAIALYEIASALPLGPERRDLGRRVLARLYEGDALTFVTLATRMAAGSARALAGAGVRARVSLALALPGTADIPIDPLAFALVSRRELARDWVGAAAMGSLPDRRLAARLLERAAREAARRVSRGDPHAARAFRGIVARGTRVDAPRLAGAARGAPSVSGSRSSALSDVIRTAWQGLLADRETLVWRHVASARGLLSNVFLEVPAEIEALLDPGLSPTEWRRGATSLVASVAVDPQRALQRAKELLRSSLLQRDPGIANAMAWGLPRVVDTEPEAAEELLRAITAAAPVGIAESLVDLTREAPGFGAAASSTCARALAVSLVATQEDAGLEALGRTLLRDLTPDEEGGTVGGSDLVRSVLAAVEAFVEVGPRQARTRALEALRVAEDTVSALEALEPGGADRTTQRAALGLLRELDASVLESGALKSLLVLGRRAGDETTGALPLDDLEERLSQWLLPAPTTDGKSSASGITLEQRRLRALLHLLDGEATDFGDDHERRARARARWTGACRVLLDRLLAAGADAPLRRAMAATLARAFDALVRDGAADPADVMLHAATRLEAPSDLEVLAEASMHPDVTLLLRSYAAFARGEAADRGAPAAAASTRSRLAALEAFLSELPGDVSQRTDTLRATLGRLSRALHASFSAPARVSFAVDAASPEVSPLVALEDALANLAQLTAGARQRCGDAAALDDARRLRMGADSLGLLLERADDESIVRAVARTVQAVEATLPPAIARLVTAVLSRLPALPREVPEGAADPAPRSVRRPGKLGSEMPMAEAALPTWMPSRRTLGGFYVQRQLGGGALGTVFLVTRTEERHDENAPRFALKVPDYDATAARSLSEAEFLRLFREEAGALLSLPEHPNLAGFVTFDAGARPKPALVMELVEGTRCDTLLESGALSIHGAISLLDGVLGGLQAMHSVGIGHLDLKPSNVILRGGREAVLVDFGLAGRHLRPGCATGCYGAPEVWGITPGATASPLPADVYSFGCLAYEVFTGRTLFDAPSEVALVSAHLTHDGLPPPVKKLARDPRLEPLAMLLFQCLRHDPRARADVTALRAELARVALPLRTLRWPVAVAGEEERESPLPLVRRR